MPGTPGNFTWRRDAPESGAEQHVKEYAGRESGRHIPLVSAVNPGRRPGRSHCIPEKGCNRNEGARSKVQQSPEAGFAHGLPDT